MADVRKKCGNQINRTKGEMTSIDLLSLQSASTSRNQNPRDRLTLVQTDFGRGICSPPSRPTSPALLRWGFSFRQNLIAQRCGKSFKTRPASDANRSRSTNGHSAVRRKAPTCRCGLRPNPGDVRLRTGSRFFPRKCGTLQPWNLDSTRRPACAPLWPVGQSEIAVGNYWCAAAITKNVWSMPSKRATAATPQLPMSSDRYHCSWEFGSTAAGAWHR